jgi:anti-sigma factor RsiW
MSEPTDGNPPHDEFETLLPWYATGQLDVPERLLLERHLTSCAHCRDELPAERRLIGEFRNMSPEVEAGWARLRQRIQTSREPRHRARSSSRKGGIMRHPAVAMLAAAQLALLAIGLGWLLTLSRPAYHTLGSQPSTPSADLLIIFRPTVTGQAMTATLRAADATIVGGPTETDAYLLRVAPEHRVDALARLRTNPAVELAQPIDEPAP